MDGVSQPRDVDYTPLRTPVGRWDAQYFVDQVKARPAYGHWRLTRSSLGWAVAALVVLLGAEIALLVLFSTRVAGRAWTPLEILLFAAGFALVVVAYASFAVTVLQGILAPRRVDALARLIRFANRNGLSYEPIAPNREYPGPRFGGLYLRDRIAAPDGAFDYGQRLQPGRHGAHSGSSAGWYLAIALEHASPPVALSRKGSAGDGTPVALEGTAAERFDLHAAPGGEALARSVFTPELLELLVDGRTSCTAEIADRWLLVFPQRPTALASYGSEALHRRMLRIATVAGQSAAVRSSRLRDDGPDAGRIAAPRRRRWEVAALLTGILLPPVVATLPFWGAVAAAVTAAAR